jgi:hypothetical protein
MKAVIRHWEKRPKGMRLSPHLDLANLSEFGKLIFIILNWHTLHGWTASLVVPLIPASSKAKSAD